MSRISLTFYLRETLNVEIIAYINLSIRALMMRREISTGHNKVKKYIYEYINKQVEVIFNRQSKTNYNTYSKLDAMQCLPKEKYSSLRPIPSEKLMPKCRKLLKGLYNYSPICTSRLSPYQISVLGTKDLSYAQFVVAFFVSLF